VFVFMIVDRKSLLLYPNRVKDVDSIPMCLVGNKCDLSAERTVMQTEGLTMSQSYGCPFWETSAKLRINVEECFQSVVREIRRVAVPNPNHKWGQIDSPDRRRKKLCLLL